MNFAQVLAGSVGALLIYCAIVNKTPAQVIKDVMANNGAALAPGTNIDPVKTGQASADLSSGHDYNLGGSAVPRPGGTPIVIPRNMN
jgi:hypothetical protein